MAELAMSNIRRGIHWWKLLVVGKQIVRQGETHLMFEFQDSSEWRGFKVCVFVFAVIQFMFCRSIIAISESRELPSDTTPYVEIESSLKLVVMSDSDFLL